MSAPSSNDEVSPPPTQSIINGHGPTGAAKLDLLDMKAMEARTKLIIENDPVAKRFYGFMGPQMDELEKGLNKQMEVFDDMNRKWEKERNEKRKAEAQKHIPQPLKNDGQTLTAVCKKIGGLLEYTNFPENYPDKKVKPTDPLSELKVEMAKLSEEMKKSPGMLAGFMPDQNALLSPSEKEEEKEDNSAPEPGEEVESDDEEFLAEGLERSSLPEISDLDRVLMLSQSLATYVTRFPAAHRERFYTRIINDTTNWLSAIFRIKDSVAMYTEEPIDGLVKVARLAIASKYPDYLEKGFDSLYSKPPVIYISEASEQGLGQALCMALGLPESCICVVPCKNPEPGQVHKMDGDAFESLVTEHMSSTREPVLLIAHASTPLIGQLDPLQKLKNVCKAKDIWIHVSGLNLATLCLMGIPTTMVPVRTCDSCTLDIEKWFGFLSCSAITFYRQEAQDLARKLGMIREARDRRLTCFPLWVALQAVGADGLTDRVKAAVKMSEILVDNFSKIMTVSILNKKPPPKKENEKVSTGLGEIIGKVISTILIFEMATPVVIFKYGKSRELPPPEVAPYAQDAAPTKEDNEEARLGRYYDSLNVWLIETVKRECPRVHLEPITLDGYGTAIKFSPLEHTELGTTLEDVEQFVTVAKRQLSIMDATVSHRESFINVVEAQDNLRYIELPGWAGIGAVQYIPSDWLDQLNELPDKGKAEVNKINAELVHQLKANDSAFSLGCAGDGLACARFGLITQDTDMEELLGLVYSTGKEIEESSRFTEQMAELVLQGIQAANQDLVKENENRLMQEGVLRQVPLVGSLVNWWSPPPKEVTTTKGRAFNLTSGQIKSTEETYKNRMQIQEPGLLTPRRQTPLKQILKSPNTPSTSETRALAPDGPVTPTNVSPGDMTTESASSSEQSTSPSSSEASVSDSTSQASPVTGSDQSTDSSPRA